MTLAVFLGLVTGMGALGLVAGLRERTPRLEAVSAAVHRPLVARSPIAPPERGVTLDHLGEGVARWAESQRFFASPNSMAFRQWLAVTETSLDRLATAVLLAGGIGVLAPGVLGLGLLTLGVKVSIATVLALSLLGAVVGGLAPLSRLVRSARRRQEHFRVVVGSFVDLVVLELAGGTGIEGALFAASQVSADWAADRITRALLTARESGTPSWSALSALGGELGVTELAELATTLQLAGTEGARVRTSLQARAESLRRHEQAHEESAANAVTERLFLPGSLLLLGFLCFVGYPAFTRVVGGI
ncbi:MAG: type II secretion system F family protein [Acidimicrobiales bacterium]|nr:type II secretion system F family protein [Acidimicrobiales bacterium]